MGDAFEYGQHIKMPRRFPESINGMAKVGLYKDEQKILQGFVHSKAEQKIDYYNKRIAEMKQKYGMDFLAFQNKIYLNATEIELGEWNDFVLWGSYVKAQRYWAQFC
jgi:hypothetical protein